MATNATTTATTAAAPKAPRKGKAAAAAPAKGKAAPAPKAATTAPNGTTKAGAQALPGKVQGLPVGMAPGAFVVVHTLQNPKQPGSGAHNRYATLLALVAKHGNGKFTAAMWAGAVGRASDLRYNTNNGAKGGWGKPFATTHATQAAALAALAPATPKAPRKVKAPAPAPVAQAPAAPAPQAPQG